MKNLKIWTSIATKEIPAVIKNPCNKENPRSRWLHWWILPTFWKELMPILLKLFQKKKKKVKRREHIQIHFMRPTLLWDQSQKNMPQKKKKNYLWQYRWKKKNFIKKQPVNWTQQHTKSVVYYDLRIPEMQRCSNIKKKKNQCGIKHWLIL